MLQKTMTYTDFNGIERTEDFYFNLTKAELMEMELGTKGGFAEMINAIVKANDVPNLIKIFKDIIKKAYGKKSADGREFVKSEEITNSFMQTEAYSDLFMELATDDEAAAEFINGIVPKELSNKAIKVEKSLPSNKTTK